MKHTKTEEGHVASQTYSSFYFYFNFYSKNKISTSVIQQKNMNNAAAFCVVS